MKITIKCRYVARQYLFDGNYDLFCQRNGRPSTAADCFKCKAKGAAQPKGAAK